MLPSPRPPPASSPPRERAFGKQEAYHRFPPLKLRASNPRNLLLTDAPPVKLPGEASLRELNDKRRFSPARQLFDDRLWNGDHPPFINPRLKQQAPFPGTPVHITSLRKLVPASRFGSPKKSATVFPTSASVRRVPRPAPRPRDGAKQRSGTYSLEWSVLGMTGSFP